MRLPDTPFADQPDAVRLRHGQYVHLTHPPEGPDQPNSGAQGAKASKAFILCIHGGGGIGGSPEMLDPFCAELVQQGPITVAAASYRLLDRDGASLDDMVDDVLRALVWARANTPEGASLYLMGVSSGGMLALEALRRAPGGVTGLILLNPMVDIGPEGFHNRANPGPGRTDINPMQTYADAQNRPRLPMIVLHGRADTVVPIDTARRFTRLFPLNVCNLIELPGAEHGFFLRPANVATTARSVARFVTAPSPAPSRVQSFPEGVRLAYCVGAQKSGTSWLHATLARSDQFHARPFKELHYFDVLYAPGETGHLKSRQADLARHAANMKDGMSPENRRTLNKVQVLSDVLRIYAVNPGEHRLYIDYVLQGRGDKTVMSDFTPSYAALDRRAFAEMDDVARASGASAPSGARFLFVMRDPIGRMWSQVRMAVGAQAPDLGDSDFEAACVTRLRQLQASGALATTTRADYMRTIAELESAVPAERIHYVFYEEMFTQARVDRICDFLGMAPVEIEAGLRVNLGRDAVIPDDALRILAPALRPQYDGVFQRFGQDVPHQWRQSLTRALAVPASEAGADT